MASCLLGKCCRTWSELELNDLKRPALEERASSMKKGKSYDKRKPLSKLVTMGIILG